MLGFWPITAGTRLLLPLTLPPRSWVAAPECHCQGSAATALCPDPWSPTRTLNRLLPELCCCYLVSVLVPELKLSPTSSGCATITSCYYRTLATAAFPPSSTSHSGESLRPRYQLHGISAYSHTLDISARATASTSMPQDLGTVIVPHAPEPRMPAPILLWGLWVSTWLTRCQGGTA